ncbi:helix-turn-helix domain-containing protein [Streptomyces sp. NPDC055092]
MLNAIGLDGVQENAYRELVEQGAADTGDLAQRLGTAQDRVLAALQGLAHRGLVKALSEAPERWAAETPSVALPPLLAQQRHELERAELAAVRLVEDYRPQKHQPLAHDLVEVVTGAGAVSQRLTQLQLGAEREICALITTQPLAVSSEQNAAAEILASSRGVTYRVVMGRDMFPENGTITADLTAALRRGTQVRVVDTVPTKLVIADRARALLPVHSGPAPEPAAVVAHSSGLLVSLVALFESLWRQGLPLRLGEDDRVEQEPDPCPAAMDLQILSLILIGLTDVSIARELGLGARTVQRRLKHLMELSGSKNRLHLGWYASERGWVTRRGDAGPAHGDLDR